MKNTHVKILISFFIIIGVFIFASGSLQSGIGKIQTQLILAERNRILSPSVSLAEDSPAAQRIKSGQEEVVFVKLKISSGSKDLKINTIVVRNFAPPIYGDKITLNLYDGRRRLGSAKKIDPRNNKALFDGVNLSLPSRSSVILTITGNVSGQITTSQKIQLGIDSHKSIGASDVFNKAFPTKGEVMEIISE